MDIQTAQQSLHRRGGAPHEALQLRLRQDAVGVDELDNLIYLLRNVTEVRHYHGWYRHISLGMLAQLFLNALRLQAQRTEKNRGDTG